MNVQLQTRCSLWRAETDTYSLHKFTPDTETEIQSVYFVLFPSLLHLPSFDLYHLLYIIFCLCLFKCLLLVSYLLHLFNSSSISSYGFHLSQPFYLPILILPSTSLPTFDLVFLPPLFHPPQLPVYTLFPTFRMVH